MNAPKAYEANMAASGPATKGIMADPLALATKPPVIFKFASALLALIIYSCVSSAWYNGRCLFNDHNAICRFGSLTLISFMACVGLLGLEILFSHISSLKVRRRIAVGDVVVSGVQTIFYLILFVFLAIAWLKSDYPMFGHSINCCRIAILLSFLAIFAQAACAGFAYVRYQSGTDMSSQFMTEEQLMAEQAQYYDSAGNYVPQPQPTADMNSTYAMDYSQQQQQYDGYSTNY